MKRALIVGPGALGIGRVLAEKGYQPIVALLRPRRRKSRLRHIPVIKAHPGRLPLPKESVDLVVVAGGIGSASDIVGGLVQLARVLRRGGRLVVISPEPKTLPGRILRAPGKLFRRHLQTLSPEQLSAAFLRAGLSDLRQSQTGSFLPLLITTGRATHATHALGALYSCA